MTAPSQIPSSLWMGALVATAILFSFALACGMPFAALSAVAAIVFSSRDAMWLAGAGWLANQVIGFGFLGYPWDAMTIAWGAALGLSALMAVQLARFALGKVPVAGAPRFILAFAAAWVGQQGTVLAASVVLGGTATAFAPEVIWFILWTNTLAFAALLGAQTIGARLGVARSVTAA